MFSVGTLSGVALDWFSGLVDGPIARFDEIKDNLSVKSLTTKGRMFVLMCQGWHEGLTCVRECHVAWHMYFVDPRQYKSIILFWTLVLLSTNVMWLNVSRTL